MHSKSIPAYMYTCRWQSAVFNLVRDFALLPSQICCETSLNVTKTIIISYSWIQIHMSWWLCMKKWSIYNPIVYIIYLQWSVCSTFCSIYTCRLPMGAVVAQRLHLCRLPSFEIMFFTILWFTKWKSKFWISLLIVLSSLPSMLSKLEFKSGLIYM